MVPLNPTNPVYFVPRSLNHLDATNPHLSLLLDGISIGVLLHDECVGRLVHFCHAVLVVRHIFLELVKLLLQHLHVFQISTEFLCARRKTDVEG